VQVTLVCCARPRLASNSATVTQLRALFEVHLQPIRVLSSVLAVLSAWQLSSLS